MDSSEFRVFGKAAIDCIANYCDTIRQRDVLPSIEPGELIRQLPDSAPEQPENWTNILKDFNEIIIPATTHWHSPQFHSYFPCGNSYASIVGSLLSNGLGVMGTSWLASPACTELEVIMLNWLGRLMDLPKQFLNESPGLGGGVIQGSASESTLVCLFAAQHRLLRILKEQNKCFDEEETKSKLIAYASDQSNSSVEKAGSLGSMKIRILPTDHNGRLEKEKLKQAFEVDKALGLIPCYVVANFGTTGTCAFDSLEELGPVCQEEGVWLHVDAAYAGTTLICPEYRHLMKNLEYADSFVFNPHKWLVVNFCCSVMWVKNCYDLIKTFNLQNTHLNEQKSPSKIPDYRHLQISEGRKFRSLKLWSVLKNYGAVGIRQHIKTQVSLANYFATLVQTDGRLIIEPEPSLTVVCFRLRHGDKLTQKLLEHLVDEKKIFMVATTFRSHYVIRFVVCSRLTQSEDVDKSWKIIQEGVNHVLYDRIILRRNSYVHNKTHRNSIDVERI